MNTIEKQWGVFYKDLDSIKNFNLNNGVFHETLRHGYYPVQAKIICSSFKNIPDLDITEVGCAYGGLCRKIHEIAKPKSYTVVDNRSMLRFARNHLKGLNVSFVDATDVEKHFASLTDGKGLFISSFCISETPREYQDYILDVAIRKFGNLYVVDSDTATDYMQRLDAAINAAFSEVIMSKYPQLMKATQYIGRLAK